MSSSIFQAFFQHFPHFSTAFRLSRRGFYFEISLNEYFSLNSETYRLTPRNIFKPLSGKALKFRYRYHIFFLAGCTLAVPLCEFIVLFFISKTFMVQKNLSASTPSYPFHFWLMVKVSSWTSLRLSWLWTVKERRRSEPIKVPSCDAATQKFIGDRWNWNIDGLSESTTYCGLLNHLKRK